MDGRIRRKLAARIAVVVLGMLVLVSTWLSAEEEETGIIERGVFKLDFRKGGSRSWGRLFFKDKEFFGGWAGAGLRDKEGKTQMTSVIFEPQPDQIEEKDDYVDIKCSRTYEDTGFTHTVRAKMYENNKVKIIIGLKFSKDWDGSNIFILPTLSSILLNARYKVMNTDGEEAEGVIEANPDGKWIWFPPRFTPAARKMEIYPVSGGKFTMTTRRADNPEGGFIITHSPGGGLRFPMWQQKQGFPAGYYNQLEVTFEYSEEAEYTSGEETDA